MPPIMLDEQRDQRETLVARSKCDRLLQWAGGAPRRQPKDVKARPRRNGGGSEVGGGKSRTLPGGGPNPPTVGGVAARVFKVNLKILKFKLELIWP